MRAKAEERGVIESGFKRAEDGWHVVKFAEGIDYLKSKKEDVEIISLNKQGDKNWKIPLVVDDETDESHEVAIDIIVAENKKGEQMVTNFLGATGLFAKFAKAFPGDVSVFSDAVMAKLKTNLPGQFMRIKTKQNEYKDKKGEQQIAVNAIGFGKMSDTIEKLEADLFPVKEGKKDAGKKDSDKAAEKAAAPDDDFL
jgi:hypothetical protein